MVNRGTFIYFGESANPSIDYLLGILMDARATTLQRVENLSKEELHWQYKAGWNTIGALLSHMIADSYFFRIYFIEGRELTEDENAKWLPGMEMGEYLPRLINDKSIEDYMAELEEAKRLLFTAIKTLSFDKFKVRKDGYDPKTGYNLAWVLYHLAEDEVHHRGQISILRKLYKENMASSTNG